MIKVQIQVYPHGEEKDKETIYAFEIINTLTNSRHPEYGDYTIRIEGEDGPRIYDHKRDDGLLILVREAMIMVADI